MRLVRAFYAAVGCFVSQLIPPRVADQADALTRAEEDVEVWEPHESSLGCCTFHEPAEFGDGIEPTPAVGPAGASPAAGERPPDQRPAAGHLDLILAIEHALRIHDGMTIAPDDSVSCLCGYPLTNGVLTLREHWRIHVAEVITEVLQPTP